MPSGVSIALTIFALQIVATLFGRSYEQVERTILVNVRTSLIGAVYEKSLRVSGEAAQTFTQGRILNLVNVDIEALVTFVQESHSMWITPLQVIVAITLLHNLIDNAVFFSLAVLVASLVLQASVFSLFATFQKRLLAASDSRLKTIREMLYAMRTIKLHAWEPIFHQRVTKLRDIQVVALRNFNLVIIIFVTMASLTPIIMPIVGFIVWVQRYAPGQFLNPAVVFPALTFFQLLIGPLFQLPTIGSSLVQASVSFGRIRAFLLAPESEPLAIQPNQGANSDAGADAEAAAIVIENATFKWEAVKRDKTVEDGDSQKKDDADKPDDDKKAAKKKAKKAKKGAIDSDKKEDGHNDEEVDVNVPPLEPLFRDLSLRIPKGKLTCVVGPVGAGKSSLLSAIIVNLPVTISGRIAFAPQQPWILTDTVEGNIAFAGGRREDAQLPPADRDARMSKALEVAMLEADLAMLAGGRKTMIGEKGVNLSGGQQARVSLARAVYEDADIYLLDDPISALDAHVGAAVFNRCIRGALAHKTVVLVTHQLHLLPAADLIVVLDKGKVAEVGTFDALTKDPDGALSVMMRGYTKQKRKSAAGSKTGDGDGDGGDDRATDGADGDLGGEGVGGGKDIVEDEDRATGTLRKRVWVSFFQASGGWAVVIPVVIAALMEQASAILANQWLTWWAQGKFDGLGLDGYVKVYGGLGGVQAVALFLLNGLVLLGGYLASLYYHKAALARLMRAPMSFFESQPIGRILNRFSKDIESVDQQLWVFYFFVLFSSVQLLGSFALLIAYFPAVLALIVPLIGLYYLIMVFYRASKRELKRLDATQRSPLYAHISETLAGLASIRAFKAENRFVARQRLLTDLFNSPRYLYLCSPIWVSIRIELLASLLTLTISLLGVTGKVDPSTIGLTLTYALGIIESMGFLIKSVAQVESEMNAVERLDFYSNDIPVEAPSELPTDPDASWPSAGAVTISNLEVRYPSRPDHAVLKEFTIDIKPGEKIGIVGRTGSGKSTLLAVLFRIVEPAAGTVLIDGQNIQELGLATLRSRLQIITQEPTLFTGTLRTNLDVENRFTDADVWEVLEWIGMKEYVASLPEKLDGAVAEGGRNLSVGQRQLVCLGRAILQKSKLLFLDEATASVDPAADLLIQESIRTHFKSSTVISIAHRLNTIAGFDRVLVLDRGAVVEFDRPAVLLDKPRGDAAVFRSLAEATGEQNFEALREAARKREVEREREEAEAEAAAASATTLGTSSTAAGAV
ncbi:P-loop containing nucleoside triphosphate hydrolase protein [Zopfochytrium polystomum]|nr:P-loop containing nucleoside triphosphate hydrolase protein [Zopfochytrium polystomum]